MRVYEGIIKQEREEIVRVRRVNGEEWEGSEWARFAMIKKAVD